MLHMRNIATSNLVEGGTLVYVVYGDICSDVVTMILDILNLC